MKQTIRFDPNRDALLVGGRVRAWNDGAQLILHKQDVAGHTATQLRNALLRAQDHYGTGDVVDFAETDDVDFDEDYVFVTGISLSVLAPAPFIEIDFFDERYEDELDAHGAAGVGLAGFPPNALFAGVGVATALGRLLAIASVVPLAGLVWFLSAATPAHGQGGSPEIQIGWPDRFCLLAYLAWVVLAAIGVLHAV